MVVTCQLGGLGKSHDKKTCGVYGYQPAVKTKVGPFQFSVFGCLSCTQPYFPYKQLSEAGLVHIHCAVLTAKFLQWFYNRFVGNEPLGNELVSC